MLCLQVELLSRELNKQTTKHYYSLLIRKGGIENEKTQHPKGTVNVTKHKVVHFAQNVRNGNKMQ